MKNILQRIYLYIVKLGGFKVKEIEVTNNITFAPEVSDKSLLYNRIRRLYLEHSYIIDPSDRILFVDEMITKEFDISKVDLIELYNLVIEENKDYVRATIKTR